MVGEESGEWRVYREGAAAVLTSLLRAPGIFLGRSYTSNDVILYLRQRVTFFMHVSY